MDGTIALDAETIPIWGNLRDFEDFLRTADGEETLFEDEGDE